MNKQKTKPNAKCPCGSGKKFKKCCRSTNRSIQAMMRCDPRDYMTPFIKWCIKNVDPEEMNYNPFENMMIQEQLKQHIQMKIEHTFNESYFSSNPKYCQPEDLLRFKEHRGGEIHTFPNGLGNNVGWFSLCFQNSFFWCQYRKKYGEVWKPRIGWLMTGLPMEMANRASAKTVNGAPCMWKGEEQTFAAELHIVVEKDDGAWWDPTPDYDVSIKEKIFITDPKLQEMLDACDYEDRHHYTQIIENIKQFTDKGTGFLHKPSMFEWRCPHIIVGRW